MEYTIRENDGTGISYMNEFLYEAIFIPDGPKPPPKILSLLPNYTNLC